MPRRIEATLERLAQCSDEAPVALGRYDVVRRLGRGGMGSVYEAIDRERGTRVALKTLLDANPAAAIQLKREFRVAADVAHPNLAPLHELAEVDGLYFFTMARVQGDNFSIWARNDADHPSVEIPLTRTRSARGAPLTVGDGETTKLERPGLDGPAIAIAAATTDSAIDESSYGPPSRAYDDIRRGFLELAKAIGALHDVGLYHGDIKPTNVLVGEDERVVVVDFGLAGSLRSHDRRQHLSGGTPPYMPPEQLGGGDGGSHSDWYAVGVMLYRILTGRLPFKADSLLGLLFKKRHNIPAPPSTLVPSVPAELSALCMSLIAADPEKRAGRDEIMLVLETGQSTASKTDDRRGTSDFVGREHELFLLEHAYGGARAGRLTLVHAHGPSGIGKSALLNSFLGGVRDLDDALVLRGRCYERESMPYKAFDRMIDEIAEHMQSMPPAEAQALLPDWVGALATVFPALTSVEAVRTAIGDDPLPNDALELRRRAWAGLAELLEALRKRGPVVLHIDDLQWIDADSAQLLEELVCGPRSASLLLMLSYRPGAKDAPALASYFERTARRFDGEQLIDVGLAELSEKEAKELARLTLEDIGGPLDEERIAFIAEEAGGVPFFIEELAHFVADGRKETSDKNVSLEHAILSRVAALPAEQQKLVEAIAVAGTPIAQSVVFDAVEIDAANLMPLLALRSRSLVIWQGAGADDAVSIYHDRIRESVVAALGDDVEKPLHLAIGYALARRHEKDPNGPWVLEAARHLSMAAELITEPDARLSAASLHLEAARRSRKSAAFPLAFRCFEAGAALLPEDAWTAHYDLALELHVGAAESAYLSREDDARAARTADVKANARSALDQMPVWEVEIDALVGKQEFAAAITSATAALALLGVTQASDPTEADVGAAIESVLGRLAATTPEAFEKLPNVEDPHVAAAMRIQVRLSPVAYVGRPLLLPIIACNLITTSIDNGLSNATPYALGLFGLVLNSLEMFPLAHTWGLLARRLLERFPDRSLEAATHHLVFNFVCCWMAPLSSVLPSARAIFDIGCKNGDFEYASYGAHSYVFNASYSGTPLEPLLDEAIDFTKGMRSLGPVTALHLHTTVEQYLKALTGRSKTPWTLDDENFDEQTVLAQTEASGSRSGVFVLHFLMGMARFYFGRQAEAAACFVHARRCADSAPSTWHIPILHQFGALAACHVVANETDEEAKGQLWAIVDDCLAALKRLAGHHDGNFGHRVLIVEGEILRTKGEREAALEKFDQAISSARRQSWVNDIALANELAARCIDKPSEVRRYRRAARAAYSAWGASAKAAQLADEMQ